MGGRLTCQSYNLTTGFLLLFAVFIVTGSSYQGYRLKLLTRLVPIALTPFSLDSISFEDVSKCRSSSWLEMPSFAYTIDRCLNRPVFAGG